MILLPLLVLVSWFVLTGLVPSIRAWHWTMKLFLGVLLIMSAIFGALLGA